MEVPEDFGCEKVRVRHTRGKATAFVSSSSDGAISWDPALALLRDVGVKDSWLGELLLSAVAEAERKPSALRICGCRSVVERTKPAATPPVASAKKVDSSIASLRLLNLDSVLYTRDAEELWRGTEDASYSGILESRATSSAWLTTVLGNSCSDDVRVRVSFGATTIDDRLPFLDRPTAINRKN